MSFDFHPDRSRRVIIADTKPPEHLNLATQTSQPACWVRPLTALVMVDHSQCKLVVETGSRIVISEILAPTLVQGRLLERQAMPTMVPRF
jgi:hypothetical protein